MLAETSLQLALERVVEQACLLTGSERGSITVLDADGSVEMTVPDAVSGQGIRSVDILFRGEILGHLQIQPLPRQDSSTGDDGVLQFLASTAGLVIENSRLAVDVARREKWVRASSEITRTLLQRGNDHTLHDIALRLLELVDADVVKVALQVEGADRMRIDVAVTPGEDAAGQEYDTSGTLSRAIVETGEPVRLADAAEVAGSEVHVSESARIGPVLGLPLLVAGRPRGALLVGRLQGRPSFSMTDLEMATAFAGQAALALELVDTRAAQERIAQWEDRSRIARDLHDVVIQQLFATGLTVRGLIRADTEPRTQGLEQVIEDLDEAISQIRMSIFALQDSAANSSSARSAVMDTVTGLDEAWERAPMVRFSGPVDALTPSHRHAEIRAVLGELLANVAKHANASQVDVDVSAEGGWLLLRVADDGVGMTGEGRGTGLANLRSRARVLNGQMNVESAPGTGTTVSWTVPIDEPAGG